MLLNTFDKDHSKTARSACIPSYLWLLVSDSLAERLEGFYCRVKQGVLIFYLPVVRLW